MPGIGYGSIGLKPHILAGLQKITDDYYPGMFLPSSLIIMMNETKRGFYKVESHENRLDLSGKYGSVTVRSDVKEWLEKNYELLKDDYKERYKVENFTQFISYFLTNTFESKRDSQKNVIQLNESEFTWLHSEYKKRRKEYAQKYDIRTFERFADVYIKQLLEKVQEAKKILSS
ncbi:MAG: hypothetical protein HW410_1562 [Nitrosarchaeum sp.]|nr:hypothetical protein [Nitrosarchaeum sp.]